MKKFLSLVLALVMAMSLVTISAGATEYKDLTDKASVTYTEAVQVMNGLGIISGYSDGSFKPAATLTRGAAAKIIAYLNLGTDAAASLTCEAAPYSDVKTTDTFAPFIAFCKNAKLIDGYADGTFKAGNTLTGFQFAKMLLTSLGYDSAIEGFTGANWSVNVAKLAVKIGLFKGNNAFVGTKVVTREEACLYSFNTLKANTVDYYSKGTNININGVQVVTGASSPTPVTVTESSSTDYTRTVGSTTIGTQQFCEAHFVDLHKISATNYDGMPGYKWGVKNDKAVSDIFSSGTVLGTITNGTVVSLATDKTSSKYIAQANSPITYYVNGVVISDTATSSATQTVTVNGTAKYFYVSADKLMESTSANTAGTEYTVSGVAVKLIDTGDDGKVDAVVITEKVVKTATAATKTTTTGAVTSVTVGGVLGSSQNVDNVTGYQNIAKDDVVLYYMTGTGSSAHYFIEKTTPVTGTLTQITKTTSSYAYTVNGTQYSWNASCGTAAPTTLTGADAVYYVNAAGEIVHTTAVGAAGNYAYVIGAQASVSTALTASVTVTAKVLVALPDGTLGTYTLKTTKASNGDYTAAGVTLYDHTASGTDSALSTAAQTAINGIKSDVLAYSLSGDTITLTAVAAADTAANDNNKTVIATTSATIDKNQTAVAASSNSILMNSKTVYVYYNSSANTTTVYTGNSGLERQINTGALVVASSDGTNYTAKIVFTTGTTATSTAKYIYVDAAAYSAAIVDNQTQYTYTGKAVDGTDVSVVAKGTALTKTGLYTYNSDNTIADTNNVADNTYSTAVAASTPYTYGNATVSGSLIKIGSGNWFNTTDATTTTYINTDLSEVNNNKVFVVAEVSNGSLTNNVLAIFVVAD